VPHDLILPLGHNASMSWRYPPYFSGVLKQVMGSWGRINLVLERVLSFVEYADLLKWHPNAYLPQIVIRISNG
jgi:hypothetical protein